MQSLCGKSLSSTHNRHRHHHHEFISAKAQCSRILVIRAVGLLGGTAEVSMTIL